MNLDLKFYWRLAVRRSPAMAALFLLCSVLGIALALKLPTTYSTTARLLVEPPQITAEAGTATRGEAAQLEVIQNRLLTRANLLDIANNRKVFGPDHNLSPDEMMEEMQDATHIERSAGRNRATFMSITFDASDGRTAAAVVNDFVTLVLQENTRINTGQSGDRLAFFKQEVKRLESELNQQNARILEFKAANSDSLPDSLTYRLNRQGFLQERLARLERAIAGQKEQRDRIVAVFEATGVSGLTPQAELTPSQQQLKNMQTDLENALAVYSQTNPRVVLLKKRIKVLEDRVATEIGNLPENTGTTTDPRNSLFDINLAQVDSQIESLEVERQRTEAELIEIQTSIERTSPNQITLESLDRDHANLRHQYNEAVAQANSASMNDRIQANNKGQRITVIEPASIPNAPTSPNRPAIAAAGVGAGLLSMVGLFMILELLNRSVRRPVEITTALGITPIGTIPYMETTRHKWTRRSFRMISLLVVVIGVPAGLWAVDQYYLPLDLLAERAIGKLGIN